MPEIWEDDDNDSDLVKSLRKQIKTLTTSKTEAEARAAAAEGSLKAVTLKSTLADKVKNPERAAKFLAKEDVDVSDPDALNAWLKENEDLFPAKDTSEAPPSAEAEQQDGPDPETQTGYNQFAHLNQVHRPADMTKLDEVLRALPDDATDEAVYAAMRKAGV